MDQVIPGSILNIFKNNDASSPICLQVALMRHMNERVRFLLSDGVYSINAVFNPTGHKIDLKSFYKLSILRSTNYTFSRVQDKTYLILYDAENVGSLDTPLTSDALVIDKYLMEHPEDNNLDIASLAHNNSNNNNNNNDNNIKQLSESAQPQKVESNDSNTVSNNMVSMNSNKSQNSAPSQFKNLTTIDQLSPYRRLWSIKARVSYKGDLRTWEKPKSSGKLFSVHFLDETGEIKANAFNTVAEKFYDMLQENQVYYITKGIIQTAKKQFSSLPNDYEINLEKDTIIEPANDDNGVPQMQFNFVNLDNIQNLQTNEIIDVLGIIKSVDEKKEIVAKKTGKTFDRRDITIVDDSQFAISVALWNKIARDFNLDVGTPIAIKGCKVNEYRGKQLSMVPSAIILPNPDIPKAYKLKGWFDNEGSSGSFKSMQNQSTNSSDLTSKESILDRTTIKLVNENKLGLNGKDDYFAIKASVTFIKSDKFCYPACSSEGCMKKVIEQNDGTWRCERCSINHPKPFYRYMLSISTADSTGQLWLNMFNDRAEKLMGCPASKLMEIKDDSDNDKLRAYFANNVLFKEYAFRVRARLDSYQGVDRVRYEVVSLAPIDPSSECEALVDILNEFKI